MYIIVKKNENFPPPHEMRKYLSPPICLKTYFPPHPLEKFPPPHSLGGGDTMTNRDTGLRGREGLRKIGCPIIYKQFFCENESQKMEILYF